MTSIGAPSKSPSSIDFIFIVKSRNGGSSIICPTVSKLINVYGKLQLCEADTTCNASNLIVVIEKCYRCRCTCTCPSVTIIACSMVKYGECVQTVNKTERPNRKKLSLLVDMLFIFSLLFQFLKNATQDYAQIIKTLTI